MWWRFLLSSFVSPSLCNAGAADFLSVGAAATSVWGRLVRCTLRACPQVSHCNYAGVAQSPDRGSASLPECHMPYGVLEKIVSPISTVCSAVCMAAELKPACAATGFAQGLSLEARQPSEPLPQRAGSGQIEGVEAGAGGDMPSALGSVQEAARQALAMAERHRMHAAGEQPQLDGETQVLLACRMYIYRRMQGHCSAV